MNWEFNDSYIIGRTSDKLLENTKVAAFDMDDTLIRTKSGEIFGKDEHDWELFDVSVSGKLSKLLGDGYNLVIISNQKGIGDGKVDRDMFLKKIGNVVNFLNMDVVFICSLNDDFYRKPRIGMWSLVNGNKKSFFCGDAGGLDKRKINGINIDKDFSDTDLKFAHNLGIKFMHRDEFIYGVEYDHYDIKYPITFSNMKLRTFVFKPSHQEMIINIGFPASGKSYYSNKFVIPNGYEYVNQDTLKTTKKCLSFTENALKNKKSVVIDNTNLTKETRKEFIDLAKKYKFKVRCLNFVTQIDICIHNSYFRNYITNGKTKVIPKIVYNMMKKKYVKPELNEGFDEINEIEFNIDENKDLYEKYYF